MWTIVDTEITKAEAREKVYGELLKHEENIPVNKTKDERSLKSVKGKDRMKLSASEYSFSFATKVGMPVERVTRERTVKNADKVEGLCPCCNKSHQLDDCGDFIKKSMEE